METTETFEVPACSNTAKEINHQPQVWGETYNFLLQQKEKIASFLNNILQTSGAEIILTGAGTSAYIGEILLSPFFRNTGVSTKSVPTTDIVTHPGNFFSRTTPTLLVSFARSGDSPESLATFELAEKHHDVVYHLIITCNAEGKLAKAAQGKSNCLVFLLPEATNDLALAMTSSFTSMTLAGLLISDIKNLESNKNNVALLVETGRVILGQYAQELKKVALLDFKRVVFLGSGSLKGTAKEAHLKMVELTNGEIICQYESYLGFRHGPKAIIDESTLMIYLLSSNPYVHNYEQDLIKAISQSEKFLFSIGIGKADESVSELTDLVINLGTACHDLPDEFLSICSIVPAQLLGYYKSLELGLVPDSPSTNGGIHRVVQGVTIYPIPE